MVKTAEEFKELIKKRIEGEEQKKKAEVMGNFSLYHNGIKNTVPNGNIDIVKFIELIKEDNPLIEQIRNEKDKDKRYELKLKLSYVTFTGTFEKRGNNKLLKSSGLICLDYDEIDNLEEVKEKLKCDNFIYCFFVSPSGNGLKVIVKIPEVKNDDEYKQYWNSVSKHFKIVKVDKGTKDISRACYLSVDKNPYFNPDSEIYTDKLQENLEEKEIKKATQINLSSGTPSINAFMDFCLTHEIPKGERHSIISRNMAIYISDNPDRKLLKEQYIKMQKGSEGELDQYLKNIDENGKEAYPFSIGELVTFTKKYKIPFKWKQVPEYIKYKELKKSEKILANEVKAEKIAEVSEINLSELKENVLTLIALKKPREATEKIMESFMDKNYIYSTRDDEKSEMWIYDNGIYIPQGKTFIKEFCGVVLGKVFTTQLANEVIEKIRVKTYIDQDEFFKTNYVYETPILDGILNLKTREVTPFTPEKVFFNKIPLNYDPKAKCEKIIKFLKDVLADGEDIKIIFEIFGFLLLKEYLIEKAFMFNGCGRNGKGKCLKLMEKFVGSENSCNVPIGSMQKDNFDLEDLFGKLINVGGDTGKTALKDTGCFKELTGRDGVNLKRKFKRTLRFVNYAKHVFACNDLPIVYDNTEGFWTKWVLLDFPYEFKTKKEIDELPERERENKKIINVNILNQISTQEELNGLLNEALNGLDRILKNDNFSYSKGTEYIKKTWKRRANSFLAFCEDCIEEDETYSIIKIKLKKEYGNYCKKYNLKTKVSNKILKDTLENEYAVEEIRDFDRNRLWSGIKFKELPMIPMVNDLIGKNLNHPIGSKRVGMLGNEDISNNSQRDFNKIEVVKIK